MNEFDQELVARTQPSNWQNPRPSGRYNLVVVGAGPAGLVCAIGAAGLGARVALIEKHRMGGDCLNYGCVPSKAVLRCARAVAEVRRASEFGIHVPEPMTVDFAAVMNRMRRLRAGLGAHDSTERFRKLGVDVYLGEGKFTGPDIVTVAGQTLTFARAVIATGARAAVLNLPGLDQVGYLTNESIFDLTELPKRLVVVGAGPIGCELAQAFRQFGSEVAVLDMLPTLIAKDDPEAAALLRRRFEHEGIELHLGVKVKRGENTDGQKFLVIEEKGQDVKLPADAILLAAGRKPNLENLGLESAGVVYDPKGVKVDDFLRTSNPRIYAAGDICSPYQFTHAADAMARIVLRNALFFGRARVSSLVIPWCTFTDPEVAHVGLTAQQAQQQGIAVQTFRVSLEEVDRAVLDGDTEGFATVHVRKGSDTIVGATIVTSHAGEMIGEVALAMTEKRGLGSFARTVHSYPTQVEVLRRLGDAYQRTRLTPLTAKVLRTILSWRR